MNRIKVITLIGALMFSGVASADLNTGLVAYYSFDDCTAKDSSKNQYNGVVSGTPGCIDSNHGKALYFNGLTDFITTGYKQNNVISYSVSAWVKLDNSDTGGTVLNNRGTEYSGGQSMTLIQSNKEENFILDSVLIGKYYKKKINDGRWHHIVGTFGSTTNSYADPKQFVIYMDGVAKVTNSNYIGSGTSPYTGVNNTIIGYHEAWKSFFKGAIDEVRIYTRKISATEVKQLYTGSLPVSQLSGTVSKAQSFGYVCSNITTGKTISIDSAIGITKWNCEQAGLFFNKGDNFTITIDGQY